MNQSWTRLQKLVFERQASKELDLDLSKSLFKALVRQIVEVFLQQMQQHQKEKERLTLEGYQSPIRFDGSTMMDCGHRETHTRGEIYEV
jgi:hypothetical protein